MAHIKRGFKAVMDAAAGGESKYLKVEPDTGVKAVIMVDPDDIISIEQHAFWQKKGNSPIFPCIKSGDEECPGCELGDKTKFRAFVPVQVKDESGDKVFKIWSIGIQLAQNLMEIADVMDGSLKGLMIQINRTGSGLGTRWNIISTGKVADVSEEELPWNIEDELPTERAKIMDMLIKAEVVKGASDSDDDGWD